MGLLEQVGRGVQGFGISVFYEIEGRKYGTSYHTSLSIVHLDSNSRFFERRKKDIKQYSKI